jgi:hypothetical protein
MKEREKLLLGGVILFLFLIGVGYFIYFSIFEFYYQRGISDVKYVTDIPCSIGSNCPSGTTCLKFNERVNPICANPNVDLYYVCPSNETAKLTGSSPRTVICN